MKTLQFLCILVLISITSAASAWKQSANLPMQSCAAQAPYGFPSTSKKTLGICRHAYVVAYDQRAKIPVWSSYTLTPQNALGCFSRSESFMTDSSVPNSATTKDYVGSPYDKGHIVPNGDMSFDKQAELESFLMTNMSPQAPSFNRGIWKLLETSVRGWTVQLNQPLTIYAGNIYSSTNITIGNGVVVPHAMYKIVINNTTGQVAGWLFPHTYPYPNLGNNLTKFRTSISHIEKLAEVKFAFPSNAVELKVGSEWVVNFGKLTAVKGNTCMVNTR